MGRSLQATPVDESTRMPLPIITQPENYEADVSSGNWHHHFHPAKHELLKGIGGSAVRDCRI